MYDLNCEPSGGEQMTDHVRLREGDVLSEMQTELCRQALNLKPYCADERMAWLAASRQLLGTVRDRPQRIAWAVQLAMACTLGMQLHGIPGVFDVVQLLEREDDENTM